MLTAKLQGDGSWLVGDAPMAIDCDGSPRAYHPDDVSGLDALANGGPRHEPYGYLLNPHTGKPYVQGADAPAFDESTRGFYVSTTSYERPEFARNDPYRYLDSESEAFIVVPGWFRRSVRGIVLGCLVEVTYRGKTVEALAGDIGPQFGEASIAVAKSLGINPDGRNGGVPAGVTYRIRPGKAADGYQLQPA